MKPSDEDMVWQSTMDSFSCSRTSMRIFLGDGFSSGTIIVRSSTLSLDPLRFLAKVACLIGEALLGEGLGDFWEPGWSSVGDTQRERFASAIFSTVGDRRLDGCRLDERRRLDDRQIGGAPCLCASALSRRGRCKESPEARNHA